MNAIQSMQDLLMNNKRNKEVITQLLTQIYDHLLSCDDQAQEDSSISLRASTTK